MKKRISLVSILILLSLFVLTACKKEVVDEKTVSEENVTITEAPSPTITGTEPDDKNNENIDNEEIQKEEDLFELSKGYADQMSKLEFSDLADRFTEEMKERVTVEYLKEVFSTTVKPLGAYLGVYSQEEATGEGYTTIMTVMEYEQNGLLLTISYTSEQQIQGIWFSYYSLEEESKSEKYSEIDIQIGKGDFVVEGKLTLPTGISNPPVVILVQGSGQSDLDETIGAVSNKPFRDIAHGLAERGVASIRYNKRFYQYADKAGLDSTIYDEVLDDVTHAIEFALKEERVNSSKIYIVGHSLGGMLAPKIATDNPQVAGIISLAGSPRNLEDIILDQGKNAMLTQTTLSEEDKAYALSQYEEAVNMVKNLSDEHLEEAILGATGYYWKSLNEIDTKKLVSDLTIPMLFLQGSADFQVFADVDFAEWKTVLEGKENASFILYENLNHLFMTTNGLSDITEYDVKGTVDPKVIEDIAEWILIRE